MANVNERKSYRFDLLFCKRFWRLLKVMIPGIASVSFWLIILVIAVSLLDQVVTYQVGLIASKYYKVFGDRDKSAFIRHTIMALVFICSKAFIKSTLLYTTKVLYVKCRQDVTAFLHSLYFRDYVYYRVNVLEKRIDNPDQRITHDTQEMCHSFAKIIAPIVISPFTIAYYTYQAAIATGYIGPVSCVAFFIVFAILNKLVMSPLVNYVFKMELREGDFRFNHMQIRVYAESAAFYHAAATERAISNSYLQRLINVMHGRILREYAVVLCTALADYLGAILSYVALAVPIFAGVYDSLSPSDLSQLVSKNAFVCIYLVSCFTKLIDLAATLTILAGTTHRVGELVEHMDALSVQGADKDTATHDHSSSDQETLLHSINDHAVRYTVATPQSFTDSVGDPGISLHSVTYGPPKSTEILCRDLTLGITRGRNLLITGDSGCGKSSLIRVIRGLWQPISGCVDWHLSQGPQAILFMPQIPYLIQGSLRDLIVYPDRPSQGAVTSDAAIEQYLLRVGLEHISQRLGGLDALPPTSWYDQLSPGEIQRLIFVRLFYHKPQFAVLDEATSQITEESERFMYEMCRDLDITVVSIGHRPSLRSFHDQNLHISGCGEWILRPVSKE